MTAPLVAITATSETREGTSRVQVNEAYLDAVRSAGLAPVVLAPVGAELVGAILDRVAGLLLTGGEDVDPARYGQSRAPQTEDPHDARDRTEIAAVTLARARGMPTLAICRGIQVVNVALGGTLIQDIPAECPGAFEHRAGNKRARAHRVDIDPDSALATAMGALEVQVNSTHHQSLGHVAPGLRVTGRAPDGVIEAVEWSGSDWWMLGVQWHPEEPMTDSATWDRGVFDAFASRLRSR